jgi:DNA-binding Lrp family transcriptional regulator
MVLQEIEPSHAPSSLILTLFAAYNQAFFMGLFFLKLERPAEPIMRDFESRMRDEPRVVQCLTVAGDIDYIILVRSKDVAHYQAFARQMLATAPGIRSYTSEVVLEVAKWTTEIPVEGA